MGERFSDFVNINPDDVKKELPEWKVGLKASARDTASVLHVESREVAEQIYNKALDSGLNVIIDGTGRDADKHTRKIKALQDAGYHVTVMMADIDVGMAINRVEYRAEVEGRYVPEDTVRKTHRKIPSNFPMISRAGDAFALFDTRRHPPMLKWSGPPDKIHDAQFVEKFKSRGRRLLAQVKKGFHIMIDSLHKAAKPPFMTVEEMARIIENAPRDYPDEKLPKKYSRRDGILFDGEMLDDFEYRRTPK